MNKVDWLWVKKEVLRHEHVRRPEIRKAVDQAIADARRLVRPKALSAVRAAETIKFKSRKFTLYLKRAGEACLFLVTIGPLLEKRASGLMSSGEALEGYLLDKIGSLAAESLAENFEKGLRKKMAQKNRSVSRRFSPGYCDWPVEDQRELDRLLGFHKAGVKLTVSSMMAPRKSISGMLSKSSSRLIWSDWIYW